LRALEGTMTEAKTFGTTRRLIPWACIAGGFAVWLAALAAMTVLPREHGAASRIGEPTGMLVLHQDPRSLQTVPLREVRPL
jgi:hypothetical protein